MFLHYLLNTFKPGKCVGFTPRLDRTMLRTKKEEKNLCPNKTASSRGLAIETSYVSCQTWQKNKHGKRIMTWACALVIKL